MYRFPIRVYRTHISDAQNLYDELYGIMPQERRIRADRFKNQKVRNQCISAYALLDHAVRDLWGDIGDGREFQDKPFDIAEDEKGKPFFTEIPLCFNISHSGDRVIVALSPLDVGCDVEHKSSNALKVAERFFSPGEYKVLKSLGNDEQAAAKFTAIWTAKESIVKCCGDGIGRGFDDFSVVDEDGNTVKTVRLPGDDSVYHIREYEGESGYRYSACSLYDSFEDSIRDVILEIH